MPTERSILCGGVPSSALPFGATRPLRLRMSGQRRNVNLCFEDIQKQLWREIPSAFLDLIELATYVYCADQAIQRGGDQDRDLGEQWRRRLFFRIPVRDPGLWSSSPVKDTLIDVLSFLSEDEYHFEFLRLEDGPAFQTYLFAPDEVDQSAKPEEIVLFSGGLDSLGGAIQEAVIDKRKIALVNHRATKKLVRRHNHLTELVRQKATAAPPMHIPVDISKNRALNKEYTQRTRSFLYASLAAAVAQMFELSRIRFYENGIVSLNMPPSAQVVGARATRTTHPRVLNGFARLFSALSAKTFVVENPFLWKTKTDVLELIAKAGCSDFIRYATSCAHLWQRTKIHPHCGECSQCIDRRFAVLAAGLQDYDPAVAYGVDLLVGERQEDKKGRPKTMVSAYVETASQMATMTPVQFFSTFGEVTRVLRHLDGSADSTAMRIFELHQRHAKQVTKVVDTAIAQNASAIRKRELPDSCLLRLVCDSSASAIRPTPAPARTPVARQAGNYITLAGEYWAIRFGSTDERVYRPDVGFAYLQLLLAHPGKSFSVAELLSCVAKEPEKYRVGDAGEILDREALRGLLTRIEEIDQELSEAEQNSDVATQQRLQEEKAWIDSELRNAQGLGGKLRRAADDRNRIRNRVCNAIRRALKKIHEFDRPLSEHLKRPTLMLGYNPCYAPREEPRWSTRPGSST